MRWSLLPVGVIPILIISMLMRRSNNNVCKTFNDYYTDRDNNDNCYYNPDAYLPADEIIKRRGYPVEAYNITTDDGYIITVFRIPHGRNPTNESRQPVLLMHGMAINCECFINIGNKSLGFMLADAGYDVWLANLRGTKYGRHHVGLTSTDEKFWNFSFHESGIYDAPAQINLVSEISKQKIIWISYSMGCGVAALYGMTYPEMSEKNVKLHIWLAPALVVYEWKSLTRHILPFWSFLKSVNDWFTNGMLYIRIFPPDSLRDTLCLPFPFQMFMCQLVDMIAWGFNYKQNDPETLPVTLLYRDATSTKTFEHVLQSYYVDGKTRQFDYGPEMNMKLYGRIIPDVYDFNKLRIPVLLIRAENDLLVTKENVERLNATLPERIKPYDIYVVPDENFNHGDFFQAKDVASLLYSYILEIMAKW